MKTALQPELLAPDPATDHILGPPGAPVTVIEYGDYLSEPCVQAHQAMAILRTEFDGALRLVYRHFPDRLDHPAAELAAEAAEVMAAQGKFWPYHELLCASGVHLNAKSLRAHAESLDADLDRYDRELRDHVYLQRVQEYVEGAHHLDIRALPTFFVNGTRVDVSFGMEHLDRFIRDLLHPRHGPG